MFLDAGNLEITMQNHSVNVSGNKTNISEHREGELGTELMVTLHKEAPTWLESEVVIT